MTGYLADIPYTFNFFPEQCPVPLACAAGFAGVPGRDLGRPLAYLDLGCGNGLTALTLAAALPRAEIHGVDMNPEHVRFAAGLADRHGLTNAAFHAATFADLDVAALPKLDFIALHGVYSWVGADVHRDVRRLIERLLKPTGLAFVSYNALPGMAAYLPIREIVRGFTENNPDGPVARAREGIGYLKYMYENDAPYAVSGSRVGREIARLADHDPVYLAHEFLNEDWRPRYFSEVAAEMAESSLEYVCRAALEESARTRRAAGRFADLIAARGNRTQREAARSLILNERFRRDVYALRAPADGASVRDALGPVVFGDGRADRLRDDAEPNLPPPQAALYAALREGSRDLGEALEVPEAMKFDDETLLSALRELVADGRLRPLARRSVPVPGGVPERIRLAPPFNRYLLDDYLPAHGRCFLASPVTGDAVKLRLIGGLFLKAALEYGHGDDLVARVDAETRRAGKPVFRGERELTAADERRAYLEGKLEEHLTLTLPALVRLGIVAPA